MSQKISAMDELAAPDGADLLAVVDVSASKTHRTTVDQMRAVICGTPGTPGIAGRVSGAGAGSARAREDHTHAVALGATRAVAVDSSLDAGDGVVLVTTTVSVNLGLVDPALISGLMPQLIIDVSNNARAKPITLVRFGGAGNIDGVAANKVLDKNGGRWWLWTDGTNYFTAECAPPAVKDNFDASSAPLASNDNTQGYGAGSLWAWANTGAWICLSAATGAAVWQPVGSVSSLQEAYDAGNTIDTTGQSPVEIVTASSVVPGITIEEAAGARLYLAPAGIGADSDLTIAPNQPAPDVDGRSVVITGGVAGVAGAGTPQGGNLTLDAGLGDGGPAGNVLVGKDNAEEVLVGRSDLGKPTTIRGSTVTIDANTTVTIDANTTIVGGTTLLGGLYAGSGIDLDGSVIANGGGADFGAVTVASLTSFGPVICAAADRSVNADVSLDNATDEIVRVDASGGNRTLTLPDPAGKRKFIIKKTDTGTNTISLARFAAEQIEGTAATLVLFGSNGTSRPAWMVWSDGTNWWVA